MIIKPRTAVSPQANLGPVSTVFPPELFTHSLLRRRASNADCLGLDLPLSFLVPQLPFERTIRTIESAPCKHGPYLTPALFHSSQDSKNWYHILQRHPCSYRTRSFLLLLVPRSAAEADHTRIRSSSGSNGQRSDSRTPGPTGFNRQSSGSLPA